MLYNLINNDEEISFEDISIYKPKKENIDFSVILPTYNEKELISKIINEVSEALKNQNFEIVVVDDNSPDGTSQIVKTLIKSNKNINLLVRKRRGVFSAQQDGVKVASGKYIILMDADFSHPPVKISEMIDHINHNDVVSCSRFLPGSQIIAPFSRKYSTIMLNWVLRVILGGGWITDYTSIFLLANKKEWKKLTFYYDSVWGEAGIEIFHQAKLKRLAVEEIPFTYNFREEGNSKSDNLLKYAWVYLKRALSIKFFYRGKNEAR